MKISARTLVRTWQTLRESGVDVFRPGAAGEIAQHTSLVSAEDGADCDPVSLIEALRALELMQREQPKNLVPVDLVATLPGGLRQVAATRDVVRELIRGAKRELLVVGFAMTDREFRELLIRRGLDHVAVTVVGDRASRDGADLAAAWPPAASPLTALHDAIAKPGELRRMHGKVIVADRVRALVGSANFSVSGLQGNLELGVRLEGAIAAELCRTIEQLRDEGWLCPIVL